MTSRLPDSGNHKSDRIPPGPAGFVARTVCPDMVGQPVGWSESAASAQAQKIKVEILRSWDEVGENIVARFALSFLCAGGGIREFGGQKFSPLYIHLD